MIKHKIIVVGCGSMSNVWLDYVEQRKNAKIVGLVDVNIDRAKEMEKRRDLKVPVFSNLSEALQQVVANLVFDITIPAAHKQITTTALQANCHVFGEKPMAENLADALEVLHIAERSDKNYSIMQNRRYLKQIRSLRDYMSSGIIGQVGSIHADFFLGPHFGGFRDVMDHPLIVDMAIHTFDQARFISGADPISVYCHEYNPPGSWYKGNASAICIFEMTDGTVFSYRGSWCAEGLQTSWESDWRITGERGSVKWDGINPPICEVIDESIPKDFINNFKNQEISSSWKGREGHLGCLDDMFASVEENRLAETDSSDNIASMKMVFGAMESAKRGEKVYL